MRPASPKQVVRATASGTILLCLLLLIGSAVAAPPSSGSGLVAQTVDRPTQAAPSGLSSDDVGDITVITTQGFYVGNHPGDRNVAELIAVDRNGTVLYRNRTHQVYYDVDPVQGTTATVEYVAADRVGSDRCAASRCSLNVVERVNLTTGRVSVLYSAITPKFDGGRWHDVDRVNATHIVIADIVFDRVTMVDLRTGKIVWQWNATERYSATAGGGRADWTHINDVEVLPDGRIMASIRNMDEVVFIDPGTGVDTAWTLGADDDHRTLYEPHNPDYLPTDHGGPAVVIADSENNRIIEYHRRDGTWERAWLWRDSRLQWPRDADRLPDGNTLIVDSHGDRVIEVDTNGTVVWGVGIGRPYDAERLGTGDESRGGFAAGSIADCRGDQRCGAPVPSTQESAVRTGPVVTLKTTLPPVLVNGLLFIAPPWIQFTDLIVLGFMGLTAILWGILELAWVVG